MNNIDVFGTRSVSMESVDKDTVEDSPTVSIFVPGVDDQDHTDYLGASIWSGYNVAIQRINTGGAGNIVTGSLEASQQVQQDNRNNVVAEAISDAKENQLDNKTHEHDFNLFVVKPHMEKDIAEVVRTGSVTGVYLVDPKEAYSPEFIELINAELGTNVFNTIVEAELGVERHRAIGFKAK